MCSNKEKGVLLTLIDLYEDMPYLWKKDHKDYMNKDVRAEGFRELLVIYKNFDKNATVKTLKKKIENMRTNYAKEFKKVLASKHTDDEVHVPSLWYFNALSFLGNRTESCRDSIEDEMSSFAASTDKYTEPAFRCLPSTSTHQSSSSPSRAKSIHSNIKEPMKMSEQKELLLNIANSILKAPNSKYESYGQSIAVDLEEMSPKQRAIAQKIIAEVIYNGKMEKLNENYVFVPHITK